MSKNKISKASEVGKMNETSKGKMDKVSEASNKGLEKALQGRIYGIKDSILGAFEQRDFAEVIRLAGLIEANLLESNSKASGVKSSMGESSEQESSAGDLREDSSGDCHSDSSGDLSEDFISEGAKELGEFVASAIAISALEMAKLTQGKREITKQAVIFAKIAQNAYKTSQESQDKISQDKQSKNTQNDRAQTQNLQNAKNDNGEISQNPQDKISQNNISQNEFSQDKMVFYDFTLAKAYAANGDIAQAKELLQNLAKPFLDFHSKSNATKSCNIKRESHIDENIEGGGR